MTDTPLQPHSRLAKIAKGFSDTSLWVYPPLYTPPLRAPDDVVLNFGFMPAPGWQVGWAQAIGQRHRLCEDSMAVRWVGAHGERCTAGLIAALGDGVGGGARGEVASNAIVSHCVQYVVETTSETNTAPEQLVQWLAQGDAAVNKALCKVTTQPGASTLVSVWLDTTGRGWLTRVGDSRAYVFARAMDSAAPQMPALRQLMEDQTYQSMGEEPPLLGQEDAPARMVGAGLQGQPELVPIHLHSGDTLLLCSDGLHNWVSPTEIAEVLGSVRDQDEAANALAIVALAHGSDDDISVLLLKKN